MELRFDDLLAVLPVLGKGMLGTFLVTIVVIGAVSLLNRLTAEKGRQERNGNEGIPFTDDRDAYGG